MQQQIKISTLTGKLESFQAINTNTLSNAFCSKMRESDSICADCYSAKMLQGIRKNCVKPWQENSDILSAGLIPWDELPVINSAAFRFHAHGELINYDHLINFINICKKNPISNFALWTKRKELVNKAAKAGILPRNLILIFSNSKTDRLMLKPPINFHKVFNASKTGKTPKGAQACTGQKCRDCFACYEKHNGKTVIVEKVK